MASIAIELNDAEIRVAKRDQVVGIEPGCAVFTSEGVLLGDEALRVSRLRPERVNDRFWVDLSQDRLSNAQGAASSSADLAFAQLASLWSRFGSDADQVIFVVPGSFEHEQLRVLLGMTEACAIPVGGLVASAVAGSPRPYPGRQLAHLDIGLHNAVLTTLSQEGDCSVDAVEVVGSTGLAALRERWVTSIGAEFLSQARFDPLHDADAEQALFDSLPACFERLRVRESTRLEIEIRGARHEAEIKRAALSSVAEPLYVPLLRLLRGARASSAPLTLQVSHRLAVLPGLLAALGAEPQVEVIPIDPGAECTAALERLDEICQPRGALSLVRRLAWRSAEDEASDSDDARPTHVTHAGVAYPLGAGVFSVGREGSDLNLSASGVSDRHFTLSARAEGLVLEKAGDAGTEVNGRLVREATIVRVGDLIRIGDPGTDLSLILVPGNHGP